MASTTESMSLPNVVVGTAVAPVTPASSPMRAWAWFTAVMSTFTHSAPKTVPEGSRRSMVDDLSSFPDGVRVT